MQDPEKRRLLMQALCFGLPALAPGIADAFFFGNKDKKMPEERSIHTLTGDVRVNQQPADLETRIRAGDQVSTGEKSEVVFVVGDDSFILRDNSSIEIDGADFLIDQLRVLSGRILSVFAKRDVNSRLLLHSPTATMGIRGTGIYIEAEPDLTYACTCYGQVALSASDDPDDTELVTTTNHDSPRYITRDPARGSRIRPAPVINHTNIELRLLENLVGRDVPKRLRRTYIKY